MAIYAGEAIRIRAKVIDPETKATFFVDPDDPDPTAKLDLWSPGKNPVRDPSVRSTPDHTSSALEYRSEQGDFVIFVHTRGQGIGPDPSGDKWEPGRWSFRVTVEGSAFTNWEYGTFTLRP